MTGQRYVIGLVCARGGSKGIPRKNLRLLAGKPLIAWAIEAAKRCSFLDRVIVSTEDEEIASIARSYGAEIPFMRPVELASDDSAELLTWQHALSSLAKLDGRMPDILVNLPAVCPLRRVEDVGRCFRALFENENTDLSLTVKPAERNPYFTMITVEEGWAHMLIGSPQPIVRRQDAPEVYDIVPVAYAARGKYVLSTKSLLAGKVRATIVPADRAVDIDTELDFEFADFLMRQRIAKEPLYLEGLTRLTP